MLDPEIIVENIKTVKQAMLNRNKHIDFDQFLKWVDERRVLLAEVEEMRYKRNKKSEEVGKLKEEGKGPLSNLILGISELKNSIQKQEKQLLAIENQIEDFLLRLPNIPDESVPVGNDNKIIRLVGEPKKKSFKSKHHWEIGEKLGIIDFVTAAKISGSRFVVLKDEGCSLERAIISFFLDTHKAKGYREIMTPYLVNRAAMIGTGQLPNLEEESFKCANDDLYLIATAEISVSNTYRDSILDESLLPQKFVSYSPCFRRESGSYGKDTKGLIRNHQFNKVELVKFVDPATSNEELESLVLDAGNVLELLGLPYRVVLLSTGDIGFASAKTYDLEVWLEGDGMYREISSCSNCKDFQTRRMNTRMKHSQDKKKRFLHTLNGSGVAVGRTFAAILENYQQEDGSVIIPEVLRKYTGFDVIKSKY